MQHDPHAIVTSGGSDSGGDEDSTVENNHAKQQEDADPLFDAQADKLDALHAVPKPANSDAVLQCPLCFRVVCVDCQRHTKYDNVYRAMFVSSIQVDWSEKMRYDDNTNSLVDMVGNESSEILYKVRCAECRTHVAALDLQEEVYYFSGCVASDR